MRHLLGIFLLAPLALGSIQAQQADKQIEMVQHDGNVAVKPKMIRSANPSYPLDARIEVRNGKCAIGFTVGLTGKPEQAHVVRCSDSAFAQSSLDAVKQMRFEPARDSNGAAVAVPVSAEFKYGIETAHPIPIHVRYGFASPPGTTSTDPDANGVYPLTKVVIAPVISSYRDKGVKGGVKPVHCGGVKVGQLLQDRVVGYAG